MLHFDINIKKILCGQNSGYLSKFYKQLFININSFSQMIFKLGKSSVTCNSILIMPFFIYSLPSVKLNIIS